MRAKCSRMCPQPHGRAFPLASALDLVLRRCSRPPPGRYRDRHAPNQPHTGGDWFRSCHPYSTCQRTTIDLNDLAIIANSEPNDKTDLEGYAEVWAGRRRRCGSLEAPQASSGPPQTGTHLLIAETEPRPCKIAPLRLSFGDQAPLHVASGHEPAHRPNTSA
jgi:hypothetical protein